jgi:hypothetical protein
MVPGLTLANRIGAAAEQPTGAGVVDDVVIRLQRRPDNEPLFREIARRECTEHGVLATEADQFVPTVAAVEGVVSRSSATTEATPSMAASASII